jgi:hypothetical protein
MSCGISLFYVFSINVALHECLPKVMVDVEQKIATLEVTMAYLDDEEDVDVLTRLTDKLKNLL